MKETPEREALRKKVKAIIRDTKRKVKLAGRLQKLGMSTKEAERAADLPPIL